jgi:hypothetical protein
VIAIPPGDVSVECGKSERDKPSQDAASLQLVDPAGLYLGSTLGCGADIVEWSPDSPPFFYTDSNPFDQAVRSTIPGLQPSDSVTLAGYPQDPNGQQPIIVRDGEVIGLFETPSYDQRTFVMNGLFCASSGLGEPGGATGTTSTPFRLPTYGPCDPYSASCESVFLSAARYTEFTDREIDLLPAEPWAVCDKDSPGGCVPDPKDMIVRVVMSPEDAALFVNRNQCGASEETACS